MMLPLKEYLKSIDFNQNMPLPESACGTVREAIYEVEDSATWVEVPHSIFMAWTGCRRVNGADFHGPVYSVDATRSKPWQGSRMCSCSACQEHVLPLFRPN